RQAGANDFISKSAEAPDVLARIEEMLRSVKPATPPAAPLSASQPIATPPAAAKLSASQPIPTPPIPTATQQIATLQAAAQQPAPTHDPLTGTLTSPNLLAEGRKHYSYARRHDGQLSVMAFRVDSYAEAARDAGKDVSDQVLARIAKMIAGMLRAEDSFGRVIPAIILAIRA